MPNDRFDGAPLRYALIDGEPVVYSIGANMIDNGGRPDLDRDGRPSNRLTMAWRGSSPSAGVRFPDGDWILWPPLPVSVSDPPDADVDEEYRDTSDS